VDGGTYFFTVVTHERKGFLCDSYSRECLGRAIKHTPKSYPFGIVAWVLLPDHLHCIWKLPEGDRDFSTRWRLIKKNYSYLVKSRLEADGDFRDSLTKKRELGIWQRRFWEHCIRNEGDLVRHFDYIHWNPVKHGLVERVSQWPWSTYHKYLRLRYYDGDEQVFDFEAHGDIGHE